MVDLTYNDRRSTIRTLYLDIETAPNVADVWGLWNQNVSLSQLRESGRVICFAGKWRDERRTAFFSEHHNGRDEMLAAAHEMLSAADVVVHYNGRKFDIPWLNTEFVKEGMTPPAPFQQVDLLAAVKRRFRFPSNKLAYVLPALGLEGKVSHEGHALWVKCLAGDAAAWNRMRRYCVQDTAQLQPLHDRLLPWIPNHPSLHLHGVDEGCPTCGSDDLKREGYALTNLGKYQRYSCRGCGSWFRSGKRVEGTDLRGVSA